MNNLFDALNACRPVEDIKKGGKHLKVLNNNNNLTDFMTLCDNFD